MLNGKHGKLRAMEPERIDMDLEHEVRTIMRLSDIALTVDQITQEVAERLKDEIRSILNMLVKKDELKSVHGGGPYMTHYSASPFERRI
jgi:hypothetical protein